MTQSDNFDEAKVRDLVRSHQTQNENNVVNSSKAMHDFYVMLTPDQKESLGNFLASCDLVKFAKYEPGENELRALHSSAERLVEETEPPPVTSENETHENENKPQPTEELVNRKS